MIEIHNIIYEVVIFVLILILLIGVIGMFRENVDLIQASAQVISDTEKVKQEILVPLNKAEVLGSDIVSVIRYYITDGEVQVQVTLKDGSTKTYKAEAYNANLFAIPYESRFAAGYEYNSSKKLVKAAYIEK